MPSIIFQNQIKVPAKSRPNPNSSATHFCAATHQLSKAALSQCLRRGPGCQLCVSPCQALGCSVDVPSTSVCQLLDQLINLFCFYNGSVRQAYQVSPPASPTSDLHLSSPSRHQSVFPSRLLSLQSSSQEVLAARWAQYLSHLQPGSSELHHIFTCLRTIDATNVRLRVCVCGWFGWAGSDLCLNILRRVLAKRKRGTSERLPLSRRSTRCCCSKLPSFSRPASAAL